MDLLASRPPPHPRNPRVFPPHASNGTAAQMMAAATIHAWDTETEESHPATSAGPAV